GGSGRRRRGGGLRRAGPELATDRRQLARLLGQSRSPARQRDQQHLPRAGDRAGGRRRPAVRGRRAGGELAVVAGRLLEGRGEDGHRPGSPPPDDPLQGRPPRQPQRDPQGKGPGADGGSPDRDDPRRPRYGGEEGVGTDAAARTGGDPEQGDEQAGPADRRARPSRAGRSRGGERPLLRGATVTGEGSVGHGG